MSVSGPQTVDFSISPTQPTQSEKGRSGIPLSRTKSMCHTPGMPDPSTSCGPIATSIAESCVELTPAGKCTHRHLPASPYCRCHNPYDKSSGREWIMSDSINVKLS